MFEAALLQLDHHFGASGSKIVGYYQANDAADNNGMDIIAETIALRIRKEFPEGFALVVDNTKLGSLGSELAVKAYFPDAKADNAFAYVGGVAGGDTEGTGTHQSPITLTPSTTHVLKATADLVATQTYRDLIDFDDHLDDVKQDYLNEELGVKISAAIRKAGGVA